MAVSDGEVRGLDLESRASSSAPAGARLDRAGHRGKSLAVGLGVDQDSSLPKMFAGGSGALVADDIGDDPDFRLLWQRVRCGEGLGDLAAVLGVGHGGLPSETTPEQPREL